MYENDYDDYWQEQSDRQEQQNDEALAALRERLTASDPWNDPVDTRLDGELPAAGMCNVTGGTMTLKVEDQHGNSWTFSKVSVDSERVVNGILTFERNDHGGADVEIVNVPNPCYWTTNHG
jgi:hypothetical protein